MTGTTVLLFTNLKENVFYNEIVPAFIIAVIVHMIVANFTRRGEKEVV